MKQFIMRSIVVAALCGTMPASAVTYYFSGGGFADGATFSGSFEAQDLDLDGKIDTFATPGEVTAFSGLFSGNSVFPATSFGLSALLGGAATGLVWELDGLLGDTAGEGLNLRAPGNASFMVAALLPPCDGIAVCARIQSEVEQSIFDTSRQPLSISLTPPVIPEPASWAMMIGGFALAGGALRGRQARFVRL